jgi:hypothetical protein
MKDLLKELANKRSQLQQKAANHIEKEKMQELENSLNMSFLLYKQYCVDLDIGHYFDNYGNDEYKKMVIRENAKFDNDNTHFSDIFTLIKFLDVSLFWKDKQAVHPELSLPAGIVLGKTTHNAFQEHVFSKGTYMDTKLKKRASEDTYKINALNVCNTHNMTSLNNVVTSIDNKKQQQKGKDDIELEMYQKVKEYEADRFKGLEELDNMTEFESKTTTTASKNVDMPDSDNDEYGSIAVPDVYDDDFDNDSDSETPLI